MSKSNLNKKVAVIGLGPVGMILAIHLLEAGCEVYLFEQDKIKLNLIRNEGILLNGVIKKKGKFENLYSNLDELRKSTPAYIFICVKTYQLSGVLSKLPLQDLKKSLFISAQNGIDIEYMLAARVDNTLRMVINFAGNIKAPNEVKVTFFNPPNYLASIDDSNLDQVKRMSELLTRSGLKTAAVDSFQLLKRVWEKTILNASLSALCGVGKFSIKEAMELPDTLEVIEQVIQESVEVAEAEKIKFEDDFIRKCLRYLKKAGDHFPSLAVDLINNRETEIDYFNGKIVEYGRKHYIRTSLNLVFTNMVKAMSINSIRHQIEKGGTLLPENGQIGLNIIKSEHENKGPIEGSCYLGIDLGSAYTKFTVLDELGKVHYQSKLPTLNREKIALKHVMQAILEEFPIVNSCATGYGRKHFPDADLIKTEINCAAVGVSAVFPGEKNIIDIGGEDIKVIRCDINDQVDSFYLNDKCASGTGSFIVEIAEKAELDVSEMSNLASKSMQQKELNSFCTVFAKTEIMSWLFDGASVEDIAKGIYISICNRVSKLRVDTGVPIYLVGGVIEHHPYLRKLLHDNYQQDVHITEKPQYVVSVGAALIARDQKSLKKSRKSKSVKII